MISYLLLTVFVLILHLLYKDYRKKVTIWEAQNVPHLKPWPIVGNFWKYVLLRKSLGEAVHEMCELFPEEPYFGVYYGNEPALVVQHPELMKQVTTKEFYYFSSREISEYTDNEVFTRGMFFTYGDRWKILRQNFTPLFTSSKLKNMFYLIENCCHVFKDLLADEAQQGTVEARSLMARFTMDCIGSCVFGIDTNTMGKDVENNPFRKMGDMIFEISNVRGFSVVARSMWPAVFYGLGLKTFPIEMNNFFHELMTKVFKARNYTATNRNDFVDLVLSLTKSGYIEGDSLESYTDGGGRKIRLKVDDELLVSKCTAFFAAGFETSATTLSFTLFELAKDQEAQSRVAEEVDTYLAAQGGRVQWDATTELPWTWACVSEAMRIYPVIGALFRETAHATKLDRVNLVPPMRVLLPVRALHHRVKDPLTFRPQRWMPSSTDDVPPVYLPFGDGPRTCIGLRFARMMMMAGLVTLLSGYRVELAPGMPLILEVEPRGLVTEPKQGIYLKLIPRRGSI